MTIELQISHTNNDGIVTVKLSGDLDDYFAPNLTEYLTNINRSESVSKWIVNLDDIAFMDSIGLASLVKFFRSLGDTASFELVCSKPQVLRILKTSGLYKEDNSGFFKILQLS